jgi:hypothetical protein
MIRFLRSAKFVLLAYVADADGGRVGRHGDENSCDSIMICSDGELKFHLSSGKAYDRWFPAVPFVMTGFGGLSD